MGYKQFGIDKLFVERIKLKMKNPQLNQRVQIILHGISKEDLQDRSKLSRMLIQIAKVLGEKPSERLSENIISFIVAQKIDPNNTFHLIKLWGIFR